MYLDRAYTSYIQLPIIDHFKKCMVLSINASDRKMVTGFLPSVVSEDKPTHSLPLMSFHRLSSDYLGTYIQGPFLHSNSLNNEINDLMKCFSQRPPHSQSIVHRHGSQAPAVACRWLQLFESKLPTPLDQPTHEFRICFSGETVPPHEDSYWN